MRTPYEIALPGVKSIGYVECERLLKHVVLRAVCRMKVPLQTPITPLHIGEGATCTCLREHTYNGVAETATLNFTTLEEIPTELHLAFIVEDVNGRSYLIGSRERSYPQVKCNTTTGTPENERAVRSYTVEWKALRAMIPCLR
jgi:hypothetical protein